MTNAAPGIPDGGAPADGALTLGLFHLAIKTADLDATLAFWTRVIGLRPVPRPDFDGTPVEAYARSVLHEEATP